MGKSSGGSYHGGQVDECLRIIKLYEEPWRVVLVDWLAWFWQCFWHMQFDLAEVRFEEERQPLYPYHQLIFVPVCMRVGVVMAMTMTRY